MQSAAPAKSNDSRAFRLPKQRERCSAFTLPRPRERFSAFTLVEMLVVIGIISLLLVAVIPAINSLSKSNGRKGAIGSLLGVIEQARSQAIRDGRSTYVVFATQLPGNPDAATTQRYAYRSMAIFEDDPGNPTVPKQITPWKQLPTGVSFRSKPDAITDPSDPAYLTQEKHGGVPPVPAGAPSFTFQPTSGTAKFPYLQFDATGELAWPPADTLLVIFEGSVNGTSEAIQGPKDSHNPPNPLASDAITIAHLVGRAEPTVTPTPSS